MATNCTSCGCNKLTCGCTGSYLTTPPACPTPVDCPTAQPCSEVWDAQCVTYTAATVLCDGNLVVTKDASLESILQTMANYFCESIANIPVYVVEAGDNINVTEATVGNTTTYTVEAILPVTPVKFVKEFTSSLDGLPVTITAVELAACGLPTVPCNTTSSNADFTYSISYLDGTTWYNITNIDTVVLTVNDTSGDITIVLAVPSPGDPMRVRVTIIG
jgi:hypothetical protein